jgi:hypothetical protein
MKFDIWNFYENLSRKFKFQQNATKITGILHEDVCKFTKISRRILLRMKNDPNDFCRKNQNTHFIIRHFFPKLVPFMRKYQKMPWSQRGHRQHGACAWHTGQVSLHACKHKPAVVHTHTHTHTQTRYSPGQVIGQSQRPLAATTDSTLKRQTSMPPAGFTPGITAS